MIAIILQSAELYCAKFNRKIQSPEINSDRIIEAFESEWICRLVLLTHPQITLSFLFYTHYFVLNCSLHHISKVPSQQLLPIFVLSKHLTRSLHTGMFWGGNKVWKYQWKSSSLFWLTPPSVPRTPLVTRGTEKALPVLKKSQTDVF